VVVTFDIGSMQFSLH